MSNGREQSWLPGGDKCNECRTHSRDVVLVCARCLDELKALRVKVKEYEEFIQREAQRNRAA